MDKEFYCKKKLSHFKDISKSTNLLKLSDYSQSFIDFKEKYLKQDKHSYEEISVKLHG